VEFITGENVIDLIRMADYYGILSLKEVCGDLLGEQVSENNLFYLLEIVERYDCGRLNAHCGCFLAAHFGDMWEDAPERLLSLKVSTWSEMLKSDDLQIRSEEKLFECVLQYVDQFADEPQKRLDALKTLLPGIRYTYLRARYIVQNIESNQSIQSDLLHQLLHETYRYRMFPKSSTNFKTIPRKGFQRFDKEHCSATIRLDEEEERCTLTGSGWQNVRCVVPFSVSYAYCEFKVEQGPNVMIGVVDGDCARNGYAGQYGNGWTYYSQGGMYHSGNTPSTGQTYDVGDHVGVKVDSVEGTVTFYKNGRLSTSATGLPKSSMSLYPIVCLSAMNNCVSLVINAVPPDQL